MAAVLSDATKLWDGYSEGHTTSAQTITETYRCAWSDRTAIRSSFMGSFHSEFVYDVCTDVKVRPLGDPNTVAGGPKQALLTCTYKPATFVTPEERPVDTDWANWTENWQSGGEALQMGKGFKWSTAPKSDLSKTGVQAVRVFPNAALSITGKVNTVSKADILSTIGKVNSTAVTIKGYEYPIGKLLFEGADLNEQQQADASDAAYNVTLKFSYKHVSIWNQIWRPDTSKWDGIEDQAGNPMYSEADFTATLDPSTW